MARSGGLESERKPLGGCALLRFFGTEYENAPSCDAHLPSFRGSFDFWTDLVGYPKHPGIARVSDRFGTGLGRGFGPGPALSIRRNERVAFKALEGVRVLEYCSTNSGPFCTKLMADLGAEVIHLEPPRTGDDARRSPPFPQDLPHPEKSGLFLFLNTNKLGITLDPQLPRGKKIFEELVRGVDVLVEDWPSKHMERIGLAYDDLRQLNRGRIMASLTPFGRSGPYRDYRAHPLNISHVSGQGYLLPLPSPHLERAPTMVGGSCTDFDSGQTAAVAILSALYSRGITGKGQFVEVSKQEALLSYQKVEAVIFPNTGETSTRKGPRTERLITMMFPCKDGHVISVTPLAHQWDALMELVGSSDWSTPGLSTDAGRRTDNPEALLELIGNWMKKDTKEEIWRKAQALSCPITPVNSAEDVVKSEQMNARGFFEEVEHPEAGRLKIPAKPYHFSKTPCVLERAAPLLGEHNEMVYCERLGYDAEELRELEKAGVI
jgi:crotonobetainyl-CoA:carnitine CoA-transferase CaiB-like acyl-CoA transferase